MSVIYLVVDKQNKWRGDPAEVIVCIFHSMEAAKGYVSGRWSRYSIQPGKIETSQELR